MVLDEALREVLDGWRKSLIGVTRGSSLIKFRTDGRHALSFDDPSPEEILQRLRNDGKFVIRGVDPPFDQYDSNSQDAAGVTDVGTEEAEKEHSGTVRSADVAEANVEGDGPSLPPGCELLRTTAKSERVPGILRALKKAAEDQFLDRGVNILYLAFGLLRWEDLDGNQLFSPLLLVPVKLETKSSFAEPTLIEGDDDDALNPALRLLLEERGAVLDDLPAPEDSTLNEVVEGFRTVLHGVGGVGEWRIEKSVHLGKFTFTKEAMYRDLLENEDRVISHPIVRALSTTDPTIQTDEFQFEGVDPSEVDVHAPAEDTPLVLDADSSQRAAIAAARTGKSFVMDGPPGTGKSQTIANMIGTLIHDGKTVLFVSEKAAALDVVRNRLDKIGLGSFLFDIHSAKSSRRAVAEELKETLENRVDPPKELDEVSRAALVDGRIALSDYAKASNEIRVPLNKSFHDVLGRLAQLNDVPHAPAPERSVDGITEQQLADVINAASKLSRAWRPAVEAAAFIWRGITTDRPLYRELDEARRHLERVETAAAPHRELLSSLQMENPENYARLPRALEHRDAVPDRALLHQWLTAASIDKYRIALETMVEQARARDESATALHALVGADHAAFPPAEHAPTTPRLPGAHHGISLHTMDEEALNSTSALLAGRAEALRDALEALASVAVTLGLPSPTTFVEAQKLHQIASLRERDVLPDARWFSSGEATNVRQIAGELERQHRYVAEVAAGAQKWFTPAVLNLPLQELHQRFATVHRGFGRRFSAEYKADKRLVESVLRDPSTFKSSVGHLDSAIEWADAARYMERLAATHSGALGKFWQGPQTDYRLIWKALDSAEQTINLLQSDVPTDLAAYLGGSGDHGRTRSLLDRAGLALGEWRRVCTSEDEISPGSQVLEQPIERSVDWFGSTAQNVRAAIARVRWMSAVTGRAHSLAEVDELLPVLAEASRSAQTWDEHSQEYRELFEPLMGDPAELTRGLDHAQAIRELSGGMLDDDSATRLLDAGTVTDLERSTERWLGARDRLLEFFEVERREELRHELSTLDDGIQMIEAWRADATGQQEWSDYKRHRDVLAALGLDPAIEFCAQQRINPEQIALVVEKCTLETWVEDVIEKDNRLRPLTSTDRDALVDEFRELDRRLIHHTAGRIVRAANSKRPSYSGIGETGAILKEGSRKRKHMPSRQLIGKARGAVQGLKPVFMMSPLAVSQYLPADLTFDVVIFDEASQVQPAEAINSIYRGRALVLAGDDKQLPPTTFFERSIDEDDEDDAEEKGIEGVRDYQSILELAKGSGAFPNLGLRWHYRSQHESLIAFSNYRFYEGKLITFPSALEEGEGIGVSFHNVHGMYQRGGGASNPGEARAVARRVIQHYLKNPERTLGVVTFSVAQRDAIDAALDAERRDHPELEEYFEGEDRLGGFFTRSLESVQGDERDVIFFSVGYGPDEANKIGTSFGVLNRDGGWRRLNVGITRARRAVEVFASMDPGQIPPSANENVEHLRTYLQFAQKGVQTLAMPFSPTGLDPESPFEESVINTIRKWGYEVEPQVGAAGYRVDLGVRHPEKPGLFALGVECDGYQYHSAPAARDRDRLRDSILTGLGWTMYRIWGTAWYRHRSQEETRLREAIEAAVSDDASPVIGREPLVLEHPEVVTEVVDPDELPSWMRPYIAAAPIRLPWGAAPGESDSIPLIRSALTALVEAEGPVHMNVVKERLRGWWRIGRVGARIQDNIDHAIARSSIKLSGDFLYTGELRADYVRAPSVDATRSVNEVHREELALAVAQLVGEAGFAEPEEIILQLRKFFGWKRTGDQIASSFEAAIRAAVQNGWVEEQEGMLVPAQRSAL